jgi:predicted alpha/beta hydrolase family esterase
MEEVYILPGWDSNSNSAWIPHTVRELKKRGFKVTVIDIPFSDFPIDFIWDFYLKKHLGEPSENKIVITESFGFHPLARYIQNFDTDKKFKAILSVAPFEKINYEPVRKLAKHKLCLDEIPEYLHETRLETQKKQLESWGEKFLDFKKLKNSALEFICYFSDNDKFVDLSQKEIFEKGLEAKTYVLPKAGHFSTFSGYDKFNLLLNTIYRITIKSQYTSKSLNNQ